MAAAESMVAARRSLDELYRSHAAEVYRYAYAILGNHADAEDVTQTTFVNALRALERGERPRKPSNWLITITHNIVRQRFRQQQARPTEVELVREVAQEQAESSGPSMEELVRALQRIPPSQREALVLRELEGRSYDEIAQTLNLTKGALETLLFRARRSLADELENAATCARAELDLSRRLDGRLSRKERRRLLDHIAECPACARLQVAQGKQRRAFKGLTLLPLPFALTFFKGAPSASAAAGLPSIGAAGTTATVGGTATTGGGFSLGGLAAGGVALKAAVVVAAVSVATGVGYVGVQKVERNHGPVNNPRATTSRPHAEGVAIASMPGRAAVVRPSATAKAAGATHVTRKAATSSQAPKQAGSGEHARVHGHVTASQAANVAPSHRGGSTSPRTDKVAPTVKPGSVKTNGPANGNASGDGKANGKVIGQTNLPPGTQVKSPATPATPASPGETGTPTSATPATPASPAVEHSQGSEAGNDPSVPPKETGKEPGKTS